MFEFERRIKKTNTEEKSYDINEINKKYENGDSRVVTENGAIKIGLLNEAFTSDNYDLSPEYQRRITWNNKKRSKLIESLIVNIPIPPIFLYESDYNKYEIMDGLQRVTAIIDFYDNKYPLSGLEEWKELEGKRYKDLPSKIKEGIGRRQLQTITLLKETASNDSVREDRIKRLVFERLNTGGVRLLPQEIRNAIYNGPGNIMCKELSNNQTFKKLWELPIKIEDEEDLYDEDLYYFDDDKYKRKIEKNSLYKRMYDVELVLRYFAMRHIEEFDYSLSSFLDDELKALNSYSNDERQLLKDNFVNKIEKAYKLFGDKALKLFSNNEWSNPTRTVYDPLMIALEEIDINLINENIENNCNALMNFYIRNINDETNEFSGKKQGREDILHRAELFKNFIGDLLCNQ